MHLNTCVMYSRVAQDDRSLTDSGLLSSPNIGMETPDRRNERDSFGSRRKLTWISREDGSCWRANSPVERQSIQADGSVTTIPNCPPVSAYKRCESPTRKAAESVRRKRNPGSMDFDIDEASCDFLLTGRGDCNPEPIKGGSGEIEMEIEMDISGEQGIVPCGASTGEKASAQQPSLSEDSPSSTVESGESLMVVSYLAQETDRIIKARNLLNFRSNSHAHQRTVSGHQSPTPAVAEQRSSSPSTGRSSSRKADESRDHTKSSYKYEKQYRTEPEFFGLNRTQSDKHYRVESDFSSNRSKSDKHLLYGPREPDVPASNRARGHNSRKSGEFPKSGPAAATEQQSMAPSRNADGPRPDPRTITESMKKFLEGRRTGSDMGTQIILSNRPGANQSSRTPEPLVNRAEPRQDAKNLPSRSDNRGTRRFDELHSQRGASQGPEDLKESTSNMGSPMVFSTRPNIYPTSRTPEHLANRPGIAKEGQNPPPKPNNRENRRLEHFNSPPVTMLSPLHQSTEAISRHYHFNSRPVTLHSPLHDHGPDYVSQSALPSSLERHVDSGQGNVQLGAQVRPFGNRSPHWEKFLASGEVASNEGIRNLAQWARDQTVPLGEGKPKTQVSNEVSNSVEGYISEAQRRKALSNSQISTPGHSGQEMEDLWKTPPSRHGYHPQLSPHRSVANSPFNATIRDHSQNPFTFRRVSLSGPQPATTDYNSLRGSPLVSHIRNSFPHSRPPTHQVQILSNVDKSRSDLEHTKVMVPCVDKPLTNVGNNITEKDPRKEMHTSGLSNSRSFDKEIISDKPSSQSTMVNTNEQAVSKPSTSSPPKNPRSASPAAHLQRWVANQFKLGLKSRSSSSSKDGESKEPKSKPSVQEEQLRTRKRSPWRSRPAEIFQVMTRHKAAAPKPQAGVDRVPQSGRGSDRWTDGHGHVPKTTQIDGGSSAAATPPRSKRFSSASPSRFRGFQKLFSGDHRHVAPVPISLSAAEVKSAGQPPILDSSPVNDVAGFIDRMEALNVKTVTDT